jgi:hypothetical protein
MPSTLRTFSKVVTRGLAITRASAPARGVLHHHIAGRARFRIASKQHDTAYFDRLTEQLEQRPGVQSVQTQPLTASVLVHYWGSLASVVEYARSHSLFAIDLRQPCRSASARRDSSRPSTTGSCGPAVERSTSPDWYLSDCLRQACARCWRGIRRAHSICCPMPPQPYGWAVLPTPSPWRPRSLRCSPSDNATLDPAASDL